MFKVCTGKNGPYSSLGWGRFFTVHQVLLPEALTLLMGSPSLNDKFCHSSPCALPEVMDRVWRNNDIYVLKTFHHSMKSSRSYILRYFDSCTGRHKESMRGHMEALVLFSTLPRIHTLHNCLSDRTLQ